MIALRWISLCTLVMLVGCGGGSGVPKLDISGTVTLKGAKLEQGLIQFYEMPANVPAANLSITKGEYRTNKTDALKAGTYRIAISVPQDRVEQGQVAPPTVDPIPPEYNAKSTKTVEVKTGAKNVFDFTIP
jgi:hypothetical protein